MRCRSNPYSIADEEGWAGGPRIVVLHLVVSAASSRQTGGRRAVNHSDHHHHNCSLQIPGTQNVSPVSRQSGTPRTAATRCSLGCPVPASRRRLASIPAAPAPAPAVARMRRVKVLPPALLAWTGEVPRRRRERVGARHARGRAQRHAVRAPSPGVHPSARLAMRVRRLRLVLLRRVRLLRKVESHAGPHAHAAPIAAHIGVVCGVIRVVRVVWCVAVVVVREGLQRHGMVELQAVGAGEGGAPGVKEAVEGAAAALRWVGRRCRGPRGRAVRGCKDASTGLQQ
jgi:hypothetical protein